MAAITKRRIIALLAAAEIHGGIFVRGELFRREGGGLVAAIAEGLRLAQTTGAPVVILVFFDIDGVRVGGGNFGFAHIGPPVD